MLGKSETQGQSDGLASTKKCPTVVKIRQFDEQEIKFHVPPRFVIPKNLGSPLPLRSFTSTYFDSDHHRMGQLGLTLRKRVEQGRGVWQLKIPSGNHRIELEVDSSSRRIPDHFLDLLAAFFRRAEPVQLGKLRTWRTGVCIQKEHTIVAEITMDSVTLINQNKIIHRFQEMELERKEGKAGQLKDIRKSLKKAGAKVKPLQPKVFQALQLPYPLVLPAFNPTTHPTDHIRIRLHSLTNQMLVHDPGTRLGRDTEALHQMRVATRRIRALLRAVRTFLNSEWTERVRREVGWIGSLLGEVRDWDVLLESFCQDFSELQSKEGRGFQLILNKFEDERSKARTRLLEGLRSNQYFDLLNLLESSIPDLSFQPNPLPIPDLARRAFRKLEKFVDSSQALFPSENLHRTRILVKRARYSVELAGPFLGKGTKRLLQQAKRLQELLGQHQDSLVAENRVIAFNSQSRSTGTAFVCGVIIERLRNQQRAVIQRIPRQWEKLRKVGRILQR